MVLQALMWKEWREHQWKLASALAMVLLPLFSLQWISSQRTFHYYDHVIYAINICACILPGYVAAGIAVKHRRGGNETMLALPVSSWQIFIVKTFWGILTLLLPLLIAEGIFFLLLPYNLPSVWLALIPVDTALSLYVVTLAVAMNSRSEGRALFLGVVVVGVCILWAIIGAELIRNDAVHFTNYDERYLPLWINPLVSPMMASEFPSSLRPDLQVRFVFGLLCWFCAGIRFKQQIIGVPRASDSASKAKVGRKIISAKTPVRALVWKEWREVRWILAAAFGIDLILALSFAGLYFSGVQGEDRLYRAIHQGFDALAALAPGMAVVLAIVIGVGAICSDLEKPLSSFLQAQPIRLRDWFWIKYFVGIATISIALLLPVVTVRALSTGWDENQPFWSMVFRVWAVYVTPSYGVAVFVASAARRTSFSAILATALVFFAAAISLNWPERRPLSHMLIEEPASTVWFASLFILSAAATLLLGMLARGVIAWRRNIFNSMA